MISTDNLQEHSLSPANIQLLRIFLEKVPSGGSLSNYPFPETEIKKLSDQIINSSGNQPPNNSWKTYFSEKNDGGWIIEEEAIVSGWCATLESEHDVDIRSIDSDPDEAATYSVRVSTAHRGTIVFKLFFDTESLLKASPQLTESKFLVWFLEPESGDEREGVYPWHKVTNDDFWHQIRKQVIENQSAPDETICQLDSPAVTQNFDGVKDNVKVFGKKYGEAILSHPDRVDDIQRADAELTLDAVNFAIKLESTKHLLICECTEVSSETLHAHLVVNGEAVPPKNDQAAMKIITDAHSKVRRYNDLHDDRESSTKFIRAVVGLIAVAAIPALSSVVNFFSPSGVGPLSGVYAALGIGAIGFSLVFFLYTIFPLIRLRRFSWDSPKTSDIIERTKCKILNLTYRGSWPSTSS